MFATVCFFDLGGGSMELMHIEDFKILKTICLDLGVLRLSEKFIKFDESYKNDRRRLKIEYEKLEKAITKYIPVRKEFCQVLLVGIIMPSTCLLLFFLACEERHMN